MVTEWIYTDRRFFLFFLKESASERVIASERVPRTWTRSSEVDYGQDQ